MVCRCRDHRTDRCCCLVGMGPERALDLGLREHPERNCLLKGLVAVLAQAVADSAAFVRCDSDEAAPLESFEAPYESRPLEGESVRQLCDR